MAPKNMASVRVVAGDLCQQIRSSTRRTRLPPVFLAPCLSQSAAFHRAALVGDSLATTTDPSTAARSAISPYPKIELRNAKKSSSGADASHGYSRPSLSPSSVRPIEQNFDEDPTAIVEEPPSSERDTLHISPTIRSHLSQLLAQPPFFAQAYIYGRSYLVTAGDVVRLPFLMRGVVPGDVLRLDRVTSLGSRDWTLRGGTARNEPLASGADEVQGKAQPTTENMQLTGKTEDVISQHPDLVASRDATAISPSAGFHRHGPREFLDERLFVIRARVLGTESEPMRIKEKTKRRQRHVKHVKSKHRYTMLRISEISVKRPEDLEDSTS